MPRKNTPDLWDGCWSREVSVEEDRFNLAKEEKTIRYQRIEKIIRERFGKVDGLRVIEIGAGAGTNAALLAKRGAAVTVLDYSEKVLLRSRDFFSRNNLEADFVCANALNLPTSLRQKYDIAMSFGLSEHFSGEERLQINKGHFELLKKGGVAFISVPNRLNLPYRIFKLAAETLGFWRVGEEYPYTRKELAQICRRCGIGNFLFAADSLYWSFNFINPIRYLDRIIKKKFDSKPEYDCTKIRTEQGSFLDQYFSYALVLCAFKD